MADLTSGASAKIQLDPGQSLRVEAEGGTTNVTALYGAPAGTTAVTGSTKFGPYSVPAMLRVVCASGACSYATVRDEPAANALTAPQVTALQAVVSGDRIGGPLGRAIGRLAAKRAAAGGLLGKLSGFGDSFETGVGASTPSTGGYSALLRAKYASAFASTATTGISSQTTAAYLQAAAIAIQPDDTDVSYGIVGLNQLRTYGASPSVLNDTQAATEAMLAWWAVPERFKIRIRNPANLTQANPAVLFGTGWNHAFSANYGLNLFSYTTAAGQAADFAPSWKGDTAYFWIGRTDSNTGTVTLAIDGGTPRKIAASGGFSYKQAVGDWELCLYRVPVDPSTTHTFTLKLSAGAVMLTAGMALFDSTTIDGPTVFAGSHVPLSDAGWAVTQTVGSYTAVKPNDPATVSPAWLAGNGGAANHWRVIERACNRLAADGLNVAFVDIGGGFDIAANIAADLVHPDDNGHFYLFSRFDALLSRALR